MTSSFVLKLTEQIVLFTPIWRECCGMQKYERCDHRLYDHLFVVLSIVFVFFLSFIIGNLSAVKQQYKLKMTNVSCSWRRGIFNFFSFDFAETCVVLVLNFFFFFALVYYVLQLARQKKFRRRKFHNVLLETTD